MGEDPGLRSGEVFGARGSVGGSDFGLGGAEDERRIHFGNRALHVSEQAKGQALDARSDIFSFGSVLYEMVTGRKPFLRTARVAGHPLLRGPPLPRALPPSRRQARRGDPSPSERRSRRRHRGIRARGRSPACGRDVPAQSTIRAWYKNAPGEMSMNKYSRSEFLRLTGAAAGVGLAGSTARAQSG